MKKSFILPIVAMVFAIGGAFATNALETKELDPDDVEYDPSTCQTHPNCKTTSNNTLCTGTFQVGSSCGMSQTSWKP